MSEIRAVTDSTTNIKFWLDALSNKDLTETNKKLINECLENELKSFLTPLVTNIKAADPSFTHVGDYYQLNGKT